MHIPYTRWLAGSKAVLVLANASPSPVSVGVFVPLDTLGMGGVEFLNVTLRYGGPAGTMRFAAGGESMRGWDDMSATKISTPCIAGDLEPLALTIPGDGAAGGGLLVALIVPAQ